MKIDLATITEEPLSFDEQLALAADRVDERIAADKMDVRVHGVVRPVGGGHLVTGTVTARGDLACSRCLEPVAWEMEESFSVEYRVSASAPGEADTELEDDELEVSFLQGSELDLDELAAEQVILALPMRILCDTSCAGLCPRCGANRNVAGACTCEPETDPRWEALRELASESPN